LESWYPHGKYTFRADDREERVRRQERAAAQAAAAGPSGSRGVGGGGGERRRAQSSRGSGREGPGTEETNARQRSRDLPSHARRAGEDGDGDGDGEEARIERRANAGRFLGCRLSAAVRARSLLATAVNKNKIRRSPTSSIRRAPVPLPRARCHNSRCREAPTRERETATKRPPLSYLPLYGAAPVRWSGLGRIPARSSVARVARILRSFVRSLVTLSPIPSSPLRMSHLDCPPSSCRSLLQA
jgi:hypothetical protein